MKMKRWILLSVVAGGSLLLTTLNVVPVYSTKVRTITTASGPTTVVTGKGGKRALVGGGGPVGPSASGHTCAAGNNGGATDTGVTANSIKLGATVVRSGIGSSFLGDSAVAIQALVDQVNGQGGICGRLLNLKEVDDGWQGSAGVQDLRTMIADGVFALAVSPSSEGVDALIKGGDLDKNGVPLVGADGMVKSEYSDPWVWPVATSTVSSMHIMVEQAYKRGLRTFGIVFDKDYHFGVEGAKAYDAEVKRLTGHDIPGFDPSLQHCNKTFCGIQSGQPSYPEVSTFNDACNQSNAASPNKGNNESCDLIALLLEPKTALTWLANGGLALPNGRTMAPQPLFNGDFAKACGRQCDGMVAWTSFKPPLGTYANDPAVASYVNTMQRASYGIDTRNSFTEGSYLGMEILIEALRRVGPDLTRAALRQVLDQGSYDLGLEPAISWMPGNHLGNGMMQSYTFQYNGNSFLTFAPASGFVKDKSLGKDLGGS